MFIDLLKKLLVEYPDKKVIHVVLDNFCIHSSNQTRLAEFGASPAALFTAILPRRQPD
jgi:transposase